MNTRRQRAIPFVCLLFAAAFAVAATTIYQGQDRLYEGFTRDHFLYWGWFFAAYAFAGVGLVSWIRSRSVVLAPLDRDLAVAEGGIKNHFVLGIFFNFAAASSSVWSLQSRAFAMNPTGGKR